MPLTAVRTLSPLITWVSSLAERRACSLIRVPTIRTCSKKMRTMVKMRRAKRKKQRTAERRKMKVPKTRMKAWQINLVEERHKASTLTMVLEIMKEADGRDENR